MLGAFYCSSLSRALLSILSSFCSAFPRGIDAAEWKHQYKTGRRKEGSPRKIKLLQSSNSRYLDSFISAIIMLTHSSRSHGSCPHEPTVKGGPYVSCRLEGKRPLRRNHESITHYVVPSDRTQSVQDSTVVAPYDQSHNP